MTRDSAARKALESRISFKPGYRFVLHKDSVSIRTGVQVPCAEVHDSMSTVLDTWESDTSLDVATERGAAIAALGAALECAIHEVLEWFSLDGQKLVGAHLDRVQDEVNKHAAELARWCWRHRKEYGGDVRPVRAGDEG